MVELFQKVARRVGDVLRRPVVSYANGREIVITFGQAEAHGLTGQDRSIHLDGVLGGGDGVGAAGWGVPDQHAGFGLVEVPALGLLVPVVVAAQRLEVIKTTHLNLAQVLPFTGTVCRLPLLLADFILGPSCGLSP
jgi:hypothetical protein